MCAPAHHSPRIKFRDEHIGSRKDWGAYIDLATELHRQTVARADEHIERIRARLEQSKGRA